tara:strand:+ start:575 stop:688 length:114 start_codon:yes stop_codon:yes gene_type:complete
MFSAITEVEKKLKKEIRNKACSEIFLVRVFIAFSKEW